MRRRVLGSIAIGLVLGSVALPASAGSRTATKAYTQAIGDVFVLRCDATDPATGGLGGACFDLTGSEMSIDRIAIADATGLPVGGAYQLTTGVGLDFGDVLAQGSFCGSVASVAIPQGAVALTVYVDGPAFGPLDCAPASPGVGTRGTITASFTTRF